MPLTSKPFRLDRFASIQDERITLKSGSIRINTASPMPLAWSPADDTTFTTTRAVYGISGRRHFTATQELFPVTALAVITGEPVYHWRFSGDHNTPCIGESVIYAYPTEQAYTPHVVGTVYLLQHDTHWGEPDQLTLSQALANILPDIDAEHPDADDATLVSLALVMLSARFYIVAMLPDWSSKPREYEVYRSANSTDFINHFSPLLLPVLKHLRQPA